jgi:hypothetical protein
MASCHSRSGTIHTRDIGDPRRIAEYELHLDFSFMTGGSDVRLPIIGGFEGRAQKKKLIEW